MNLSPYNLAPLAENSPLGRLAAFVSAGAMEIIIVIVVALILGAIALRNRRGE